MLVDPYSIFSFTAGTLPVETLEFRQTVVSNLADTCEFVADNSTQTCEFVIRAQTSENARLERELEIIDRRLNIGQNQQSWTAYLLLGSVTAFLIVLKMGTSSV